MIDKIIPKKSLGQHWLYDETSLRAMCTLAEVTKDDFVVEVGPGLGTLTRELLGTGAEVLAVEYDKNLADKLRAENLPNLEVVNQDILGFDWNSLPANYKLCANIPYYLTSNLIRVISQTDNRPVVVTLLIQKEVAERLCAGPGQMSLLSVWAQMYYTTNLGPLVPAELFIPPPKVDSQVVVMKRLKRPLNTDCDDKILSRALKAGFGNKRKNLINSLSGGLNMPKAEVSEILNLLSIDPNTRAQQLSLDQWISLTNKLKNT